MVALIRIGRVLLVLCVACLMLSLVIAMVSRDTGPIEKAVLVLLIVACVPLAALLTTWTKRLEHRLVTR
jgi:hypothetical protein